MILLRVAEGLLVLLSIGLMGYAAIRVSLPIIRYAQSLKPKTPASNMEELKQQLEAERLKEELDKKRAHRASELSEELEAIFEEAHKHRSRKQGGKVV